MLSPDGLNPPPPEHPDDVPFGTRFVVWSDTAGRVHGVFESWHSAMEYWARLPEPKGHQVRLVPPGYEDRLFLNPLALLRGLDAQTLPYPAEGLPYADNIERWLWGNTRTRQNLVDYLNAVGDGDGPAIDVADELTIARRALKFAARRLDAGIVE